jgi:hypothetical protein
VRYFLHPQSLHDLTYIDFYEKFTHKPHDGTEPHDGELLELPIQGVPLMKIIQRSHTQPHRAPVARIQTVRPGMGEVFYICALLCHRAVTSWNELRMIENTLHPTYAEAAQAFGLFENGNEAELAMEDAIACLRTLSQLRFLFAQLILEGGPASVLWQRFQHQLAEDFTTF